MSDNKQRRTYVNTGAPFPRSNGERWERGAVHVPSPEELAQRTYKLRPVGVAPASSQEEETEAGEVSEWPLRMKPATYLRLHPDGPNAELARTLVDNDADSDD